MRLPSIPYPNNRRSKVGTARRQQTLAFGGLDYTDDARAGKLSGCGNLSARRYPVLAPRKGRRREHTYDSATAAFTWNGKLLVVDGGIVYYDGAALGSVTEGPKQFAVVNTKLCIWPDKVYIDLTNNTFGRLDASRQTTGNLGSVVFTDHSLSAGSVPRVREDQKSQTFKNVYPYSYNPCVYVYGNDQAEVAACWDQETGAWNSERLATLETLGAVFDYEDFYNPVMPPNFPGYDPNHPDKKVFSHTVSEGDVFIPWMSGSAFGYVSGEVERDGSNVDWTLPDKSQYNSIGYYGVFTHTEPGDHAGWPNTRITWHFDIYMAGGTKAFSGTFMVGDALNVTGTLYGLLDADKSIVTGFDDPTNTILFPENTFRVPQWVKYFSAVQPIGSKIALRGTALVGPEGEETETEVYYSATLLDALGKKSVLVLYDETPTFASLPAEAEFTVWDSQAKCSLGTLTMDVTAAAPTGFTTYDLTAYATDTKVLTIYRPIPDMDFICESGNRLWGVSNRQTNTVWNEETKQIETYTSRVIYASALGQPGQWWLFEGLATDAWQVAVGSDGDFTGMIAYGGAVCCFKERRLVRVLGGYPGQYQTAEDELEGVAAGSHKSLCAVGGALLYHGRSGVYAYGGGTPRLLSEVLGEHRYENAVGGTDGSRYYISMQEGNDWHLLVYDTLRGLWFREDAAHVLDFCRLDGELLMLDSVGHLDAVDGADKDPGNTPVSWSAEFAPFPEEDGHDRRKYLRLLLRTETRAGGTVTVYVKFNGEADWRTVKTLTAADNNGGVETVVIPVWPNRLDRMRVKLTGSGDVRVLSLAREYLDDGSEYGGEANA